MGGTAGGAASADEGEGEAAGGASMCGRVCQVSLPVAMGREFGFILRWCRQFAPTSSYEARQGQGKPTMSHVQNVGVEANESLGFPAHLRHIRSCCATLFYFDFLLSSFSSFVVGWALRLLLP